jgi:hypothetical protein
MDCAGCDRESVVNLRIVYDNGEKQESCEYCGGIRTRVYDVWCPVGGYFDENLSHPDKPETTGGVWIPDKATKARILKESGLREAGDRQAGATSYDPKYSRIAHENFRNQYKGGYNGRRDD